MKSGRINRVGREYSTRGRGKALQGDRKQPLMPPTGVTGTKQGRSQTTSTCRGSQPLSLLNFSATEYRCSVVVDKLNMSGSQFSFLLSCSHTTTCRPTALRGHEAVDKETKTCIDKLWRNNRRKANWMEDRTDVHKKARCEVCLTQNQAEAYDSKKAQANSRAMRQQPCRAKKKNLRVNVAELTAPDMSPEEKKESTKAFCRVLDRLETLVANVYYSNFDSLVHIEVKEPNKREAEKTINQLKDKHAEKTGYCPEYIVELYELGEYIQTASPPRNDEVHAETSSAVMAKSTLRPATCMASTDKQQRFLFSGALNDDKLGISVAHALAVGDEVEMYAVGHQPEAYQCKFGKCVKLFESITNDLNESIPADIALIEIDPQSCNIENKIHWPPCPFNIRIYNGPPVPGNTHVMILNKKGKFKEGFVRKERVVRDILVEYGQCHMLAISSQEETMDQEAINELGDSGALVMPFPSPPYGNSIDVYGIVTSRINRTPTSSLTVANDLPAVIRILSGMGELPEHVDYK